MLLILMFAIKIQHNFFTFKIYFLLRLDFLAEKKSYVKKKHVHVSKMFKFTVKIFFYEVVCECACLFECVGRCLSVKGLSLWKLLSEKYLEL